MKTPKKGSWLEDIIRAYDKLGGEASYVDVYPVIEQLRVSQNRSWPKNAKSIIRREVEYNSPESKAFLGVGHEVFYSVKGIGDGVWGVRQEHRTKELYILPKIQQELAYSAGEEGLVKEAYYLRRQRNAVLVKWRKEKDDYTCQACKYRKEVSKGNFIIDVHHMRPLGKTVGQIITQIDDLVCLCPNCHRIAHSKKDKPLTVNEIKK